MERFLGAALRWSVGAGIAHGAAGSTARLGGAARWRETQQRAARPAVCVRGIRAKALRRLTAVRDAGVHNRRSLARAVMRLRLQPTRGNRGIARTTAHRFAETSSG